MSYYDYPVILDMHILLAFTSMTMLTVRGLGVLAGAAWPMDSRLRALNLTVDILLTVSGLSLWGLLNISPVHHSWLMAKLVLLFIYGGLGALALQHAPSLTGKALAFLGALICMGLIVGISQTREPLMGLA